MSKTGIIGGTFNPIHNGHILLALYCKEKLNLDSVILSAPSVGAFLGEVE